MICSFKQSFQLISIDLVAGYKINFLEFKNYVINFYVWTGFKLDNTVQ